MALCRLVSTTLWVCAAAFLATAADDSAAAKAKETPYTTVKAGKFTFTYKVDGVDLHAQVTYPTKGWVAVGFNPTSMMKGANMIMGALANGKTISSDEFGVNDVSHKPDTTIGGKNNILAAECTQADGATTFSFTIPLDSGDPKDTKLSVGAKVKVIFAAGATANFKDKHIDVEKKTITLQ
jgi:DOMON domain